jgi:hypothetical protein
MLTQGKPHFNNIDTARAKRKKTSDGFPLDVFYRLVIGSYDAVTAHAS